MATRSNIAYLENNIVRYIYCHNDGYIAHHGKILLEHYSNTEKVKELISLGCMSILAPNIHPSLPTHSFDNKEKGVCVFYGRDRNDKDLEFIQLNLNVELSIKEIIETIFQEEYGYLYDCNTGKWYVRYDECEDESYDNFINAFYELTPELVAQHSRP